MIRTSLILAFLVAVVVAALTLAGEAGHASIVWLGWRVDLTASALVLILILFALAAMVGWRLIVWVLDTPRRAASARAETRRRQALDVLTRGFIAAASGDGTEARRLAAKAAELATEAPGLARILAAQAAEAAAEPVAAEVAYGVMLGFPDMRLAGHKGLMQLAFAKGNRAAGLGHAEQAFGLTRTARWAWRALLESRLEDGDWDSARNLLKAGLDRKIVTPLVAERGRAALLAASAAQLETSTEARDLTKAADYALEAAKLQPGFAPGVVMAARLLAEQGKSPRAAQVLETAWKKAPHPALWLAYRDLRTSETPRQRSTRLSGLAGLNADHRESRILLVEAALIGGEAARAWDLGRGLQTEALTTRIAGLLARAAFAAGHADEARLWLAQGMGAPGEPDWSDLDPEGRAFAYQPSDWARLVVSFAETGELIHPRHERREPSLGDLPALPISYADQAHLLTQAGDTAPFPIGEGIYDEDDDLPPSPPPGAENAPVARRRLARPPRGAK